MKIGEGCKLWVLGQAVNVVTVTKDYAMVDILAPAGVPGPPPHVHKDCDETFYVLQGRIDVHVNGQTLHLSPGQCVTAPREVLHTFSNPDPAVDARVMVVINPPGFERFFLDIGVGAGQPDAQAASVAPQVVQRAIAQAGQYHMVMSLPQPA